MRTWLLLISAFLSCTAQGTPQIAPEVYRNCPRQAVVELIMEVERQFQKTVGSLSYTEHEYPPAGRRAIIVKFLPTKLSSTQVDFKSARFYLNGWKQDRALDSKQMTMSIGDWYTSGHLEQDIQTIFHVGNTDYSVRVSEEIEYQELQSLFEAIAGRTYSADLNCGSPKWTEMISSLGPQYLYDLNLQTIRGATRIKEAGSSIIELNTSKQEMWQFVQTKSGFNLQCKLEYVI